MEEQSVDYSCRIESYGYKVTGTQSESHREREQYQKLDTMLEGTYLLEPEKTQLVDQTSTAKVTLWEKQVGSL